MDATYVGNAVHAAMCALQALNAADASEVAKVSGEVRTVNMLCIRHPTPSHTPEHATRARALRDLTDRRLRLSRLSSSATVSPCRKWTSGRRCSPVSSTRQRSSDARESCAPASHTLQHTDRTRRRRCSQAPDGKHLPPRTHRCLLKHKVVDLPRRFLPRLLLSMVLHKPMLALTGSPSALNPVQLTRLMASNCYFSHAKVRARYVRLRRAWFTYDP